MPTTITGVDESADDPREPWNGGTVAEPPEAAFAPAAQRPVGQARTGVLPTGSDRRRGGDPADRHRRCGEAAAHGATIAEAPRPVIAPATHGPVSQAGTGVLQAGGDDHGGEPCDGHRRQGVVRGAVAELPHVVGSPAANRPVPGQRTGVLTTGGDRLL